MNFVQSNSVYALTADVTLEYGVGPNASGPGVGPNTAGNLGIAWCFVEAGTTPSSITDSNGNTWCPFPYVQQSGYSMNVFICASLAGGSNTVTAAFGYDTPSFHIAEYSYTKPAVIVALQPQCLGAIEPYTQGSQGVLPASPVSAYFNTLSSGVQQSATVTLFLAVYDSASQHGWGNGGYGLPRASTNESSSSGASTVSGENTVASGGSQTVFKIGYDAIFAIPPIVTSTTNVLGFAVIES